MRHRGLYKEEVHARASIQFTEPIEALVVPGLISWVRFVEWYRCDWLWKVPWKTLDEGCQIPHFAFRLDPNRVVN